MDTSTAFASLPLREPESIAADPQSALTILPDWLHAAHLEYPEGHEDDPARFPPAVTVVVGETHVTSKTLSLLQVAFLLEITRFGKAKVVTNQTRKNRKGQWPLRISFAGHREDLTMVGRVFSGAAEYDQTKVDGIQSDMRAENLRHDPAEKIGKDARQVVLGHAERIAKQLEASGRMPPHLTAEAYLDNLRRLLVLIDQEATGRELSDLLPAVREG